MGYRKKENFVDLLVWMTWKNYGDVGDVRKGLEARTNFQ